MKLMQQRTSTQAYSGMKREAPTLPSPLPLPSPKKEGLSMNERYFGNLHSRNTIIHAENANRCGRTDATNGESDGTKVDIFENFGKPRRLPLRSHFRRHGFS